MNKRITDKTNNRYGRFEMGFYEEATCLINDEGNIRRVKCRNEETYDRANTILYKGRNIKRSGHEPGLNRTQMLLSLMSKIEEYFPEGLTDYDVLIPNKIPTTGGATLNYGIRSLRKLAERLHFPIDTISDQWQILIRKVVESNEFATIRQGDDITFWGKMLALNELPWAKEIKEFIKTILVLPIGSSDAERGFSILKHARYDRRARLIQETLDAILRIRINGPDIDEFNAMKYAKLWKSAGKMLTDAPGGKNYSSKPPLDELDGDVGSGKHKGKKYLLGSNIF